MARTFGALRRRYNAHEGSLMKKLLVLPLILGVVTFLTAAALASVIAPGDSLLVSCVNQVSVTQASAQSANVVCAPNTPTAAPPAVAGGDRAILATCPAAAHDRYVPTG